MNGDEMMYDVIINAVTAMLICVCLYIFYYFFNYAVHVCNFPYDWEPGDGDSLSLVARVIHHLPLYSDWNKGSIINIYTPFYYYLAALLSLVFGFRIQLGRWISFVSALGIFIAVFFSFNSVKSKTGLFAALALAFSLVLLREGLLIEELHLTVNAIFALFTTLSLYFMQAFIDKRKTIYLDISAVMTFFALFTKQQAIAAVIAILIFLAVRDSNYRHWLRYALVLGVLSAIACVYLEFTNNFNFLNSTFFYLKELLPDNFSFGKARLANFLAEEWVITISAALALLYNILVKRKISVWNVFVVVSLPVLCYMLGNNFGGLNYMFPLWIAMIASSGQFILDLIETETTKAGYKIAAKGSAAVMLGCMMFYGISTASVTAPLFKKFTERLEPARYVMERYYSTAGKMYAEAPNRHFFSGRPSGVFILNNGISEYEYSTFATAAWPVNYRIDKNVLLKQFDNKYFGIITTGLDPFPDDMMAGVKKNYTLAATLPANCWMGRIMPIQVYVPKK